MGINKRHPELVAKVIESPGELLYTQTPSIFEVIFPLFCQFYEK